jgi:hypothetical protein
MGHRSFGHVSALGLAICTWACGGATLRTEGASVAVGAVAPDFVLADFENRPVSLGSLTREGPTVLVFYRGAW